MIVVHSTIRFAAERRDEARALVRDLADASRTEAGVVRYRAMTDLDDPDTVRFFEQYEDEAAWRAHTESEHYQAFVDALPGLVDGPMETVTVVDGTVNAHEFDADELDA